MKSLLFEFRAKVRRRGIPVAKQEIPELLEAFDGWEKQPVGEHKETYKQIVEKLNAIKTAVDGSNPNKEVVVQGAEELGNLAAKLPGKANENPMVE